MPVETLSNSIMGGCVTPVSEDHGDKYGVPSLEELGELKRALSIEFKGIVFIIYCIVPNLYEFKHKRKMLKNVGNGNHSVAGSYWLP